MNNIWLLTRFFFYGLIFFGILGFLLSNPYTNGLAISTQTIVYLGLAGGAAFSLSCTSIIILVNISKELIKND